MYTLLRYEIAQSGRVFPRWILPSYSREGVRREVLESWIWLKPCSKVHPFGIPWVRLGPSPDHPPESTGPARAVPTPPGPARAPPNPPALPSLPFLGALVLSLLRNFLVLF